MKSQYLDAKCQSRSWNAVVRTGIKMLKLKQELKISNLFLWRSVGLEVKMNDERMISQTPMVHKLDEVSSWCLADCSKYVRVSKEVSVKKSECALSCWLVLPAARKRRERKIGQVCPARKACVEEIHPARKMAEERREWKCSVMLAGYVLLLTSGEARREQEMVSAAFYVAPRRWPGQNGISHSHWMKICDDQIVKLIYTPNKKTKVLSGTFLFSIYEDCLINKITNPNMLESWNWYSHELNYNHQGCLINKVSHQIKQFI